MVVGGGELMSFFVVDGVCLCCVGNRKKTGVPTHQFSPTMTTTKRKSPRLSPPPLNDLFYRGQSMKRDGRDLSFIDDKCSCISERHNLAIHIVPSPDNVDRAILRAEMKDERASAIAVDYLRRHMRLVVHSWLFSRESRARYYKEFGAKVGRKEDKEVSLLYVEVGLSENTQT